MATKRVAKATAPLKPKRLSKTALNRAVARQQMWAVINPFTGSITHTTPTRSEARLYKSDDRIIRLLDVRVQGVRA